MEKHLYNAFRVVLAVLCVAGLLAALEISVFKEHASPLNWYHIAISTGIVGTIVACRWDRKNPPSN